MEASHATISAQKLNELLDKQAALVLVDVLPEQYFAAEHLQGAQNACVYNVDFLDRVKQLVPSLSQSIVVYGSSSKNLASSVAASKLLNAGWRSVIDFRGGVKEWREAGYQVEGTQVQQEHKMP